MSRHDSLGMFLMSVLLGGALALGGCAASTESAEEENDFASEPARPAEGNGQAAGELAAAVSEPVAPPQATHRIPSLAPGTLTYGPTPQPWQATIDE